MTTTCNPKISIMTEPKKLLVDWDHLILTKIMKHILYHRDLSIWVMELGISGSLEMA